MFLCSVILRYLCYYGIEGRNIGVIKPWWFGVDDWACRGIGGSPRVLKMAGQSFTPNFVLLRGGSGVWAATRGFLEEKIWGVGGLERSGGRPKMGSETFLMTTPALPVIYSLEMRSIYQTQEETASPGKVSLHNSNNVHQIQWLRSKQNAKRARSTAPDIQQWQWQWQQI